MYVFIPVCYEKIIILSPESLQGHRCPIFFYWLKGENKMKWGKWFFGDLSPQTIISVNKTASDIFFSPDTFKGFVVLNI